MDTCGESQLLPMGKLAITQQMGVQLRDLRLLDPQLATSYPSAILCRERALVVSEHSRLAWSFVLKAATEPRALTLVAAYAGCLLCVAKADVGGWVVRGSTSLCVLGC
mgnify:CR=1 FL=1